jgi:Domain of unknown function (DUF4129)
VTGGRRLFWSGIALTALLALVAVASRAHRPGGGNGAKAGHAPTLLADYLATLAVIMIPIGAVLLIWALMQRRHQELLAGRRNWRRTLATLVVLSALLGATAYVSESRHGLFRRSSHEGTIPSAGTSTQPKRAKSSKPESPYRAHFRWLPVLVLGSLALAVAVSLGAVALRRRRDGGAWAEEASLAAALDAVLADTLDDLRAERDPRRAVIRAYARMEKTLAAYGLPRDQAEAPLEYLARVLESLSVSAYSVRRLTQLFERAKFSRHAIDERMKDDAIEALAGLRAELEHGEVAAA